MSDRLGMIHAIHESPRDALPRLAYADWLEERGDLDHAEFIRVELALANLDRDDPRWLPLSRRDLDLIRTHKDEWFGTWRSQWGFYEMYCGFIEEVATTIPDSVLAHADWLYDHHSLLDLVVTGKLAEMRPLLHHPLASILGRLMLNARHNWMLWNPGRPARLPLAQRPLVLSLADHHAGPDLIDDLLASDHLTRLSWLDLSGNALTAEGIRILLDRLDRFPKLKSLRLAGVVQEVSHRRYAVQPNIDADGVILLAEHPAVAQLDQLDLEGNNVTGDALAALITSRHLRKIKRLNIGRGPTRAECNRLRRRFGDRVELPTEVAG